MATKRTAQIIDLSQITESVICDNIDNDLSNVLQKNQWGYRKGVSTESLLLYLTETWKINIDHGNVVGVIFTDFRKAFESVYHEVLFYKMQACGFYGNVLQWLVSYLKNRKQFVEPNGAKSQIYFVSHGVQQGSLLGPRLFSIYLNDFAESLSNGEMHLYADDTTAFATGNSVDRVIQLLNVLPKEIIQWCRVNRLTIHWGKCKTMIITKQRFIGPLQQVKCGDVVLDFTEVAKCSPNLARILSYWTDDDKMTSKVQSGCRLLNR